MNIPGRHVPPKSVPAKIQPAIDHFQSNALIGMEYTVELLEKDGREPDYYCVLCDRYQGPRNIMRHWISFKHRMIYLERHFQAAVHKLNQVKNKSYSRKVIFAIVHKLACTIEEYHGRLHLSVYSADDFRLMKNKIVNKVNAKLHYDERNGPNFVNVFDCSLPKENSPQKKIELTPNINMTAPKRSINALLSDKSNRETLNDISSDSDSQHGAKKHKKNEQMPPFEKDHDKFLPSPKELLIQAEHITQERYKCEKYRCLLEQQLKQMRNELEEWETDPKHHPFYAEEWNNFCKRRYKELHCEKKVNPNKYDYKSEWNDFWKKRMIEIFNADVERKKKEIEMKLGLHEDAEKKFDKLIAKYKVQVPPKPRGRKLKSVIRDPDSPRRRRRRRSRSGSFMRWDSQHSRPISPCQRRGHKRSHRSKSRSVKRHRHHRHHRHHHRHRSTHLSSATRSYPSPRSHNRGAAAKYLRHYRVMNAPEYPKYDSTKSPKIKEPFKKAYRVMNTPEYPKYDSTKSPKIKEPFKKAYRVMNAPEYPKYDSTKSPKIKEPFKEAKPQPVDEGPITVVAVLRFLTALEEHLGCLGPKIVEMFGKALALEKVKANSSDAVLLIDDHYLFFEVIKEKLKGLLIADVVPDPLKVCAIKKAVKNIDAIIYQINTKGKEIVTEKAATNAVQGESEKISKSEGDNASLRDLPFERAMVAKPLAAALDVSPELNIITPNNMHNCRTDFAEKIQADQTDEAKTPDGDSLDNANSETVHLLTDSDLQTLLQNFNKLTAEEQHKTIVYIKKLDAARTEKLREYINLIAPANVSARSKTVISMKAAEQERQVIPRNSNSNTFDDNNFSSSSIKKHADHSNDKHNRQRKGVFSNRSSDDKDDDNPFDEISKAASNNLKRSSESSGQHLKTGQTRKTTKTAPEPIVPFSASSDALKFNPAGLTFSLPADSQNIKATVMGSPHISNTDKTAAAAGSATVPEPVPAVGTGNQQPTQNPIQQPAPQQLQPIMMPANNSYYQQGHYPQHLRHPQMQQIQQQRNLSTAINYNQMGVYNNTIGYGGYPQWGNVGQQVPQQAYHMLSIRQQFGQQPQQQLPQPPMGINNLMYVRRSN